MIKLMKLNPPTLLTRWSTFLMKQLAHAGVSQVMISPGSRSTPLVLAALQEPRFHCYQSLDERTAAFFALGQARLSHKPSLLICTSGTAAAHYYPALLEASAAGIPLLLLTADRPFFLQDCGANQTMDQVKMFGGAVRHFFPLGLPEPSASAFRGLRRSITQAVWMSQFPHPGPVHINFPADKPLEPIWNQAINSTLNQIDLTQTNVSSIDLSQTEISEMDLDQKLDHLISLVQIENMTKVRPSIISAHPQDIKEAAQRILTAQKGLVIAGPAALSQAEHQKDVNEFLQKTGFAWYAEASSQFRFVKSKPMSSAVCVDGLELLLQLPAFRKAFVPDVIVQIGASLTSSLWERYLEEHPHCPKIVLSNFEWLDPQNTAAHLLIGDLSATLQSLCKQLVSLSADESCFSSKEKVTTSQEESINFVRNLSFEESALPLLHQNKTWQEHLYVLNQQAWQGVQQLLEEPGSVSNSSQERSFLEVKAVRTVVRQLPIDSYLILGNSLPIREVEKVCPQNDAQAFVLSQRGLSGIDGLISGACGTASLAKKPVTVLMGDISFLHDLSGLALAKYSQVPLVIVVLNNQGGRIFEQLPLAQAIKSNPEKENNGGQGNLEAMSYFTTPHSYSFMHAAHMYDCAYEAITSISALKKALQTAYQFLGCTVIEAKVEKESATWFYQELQNRLIADFAKTDFLTILTA